VLPAVEVDFGTICLPRAPSPVPDFDEVFGGGTRADALPRRRREVGMAFFGGDRSKGAKSPWHSASNLLRLSIGKGLVGLCRYLRIRLNEAQDCRHSASFLH
jgi:hypothetical protein